MQQSEFDTLDETLDVAARHASRALIALGALRSSPDPEHRAAYRSIHDLIGDLGGLKVQLGIMEPRNDAAAHRLSALDADAVRRHCTPALVASLTLDSRRRGE
ncbi:hypothetical protein [Nocardioides lianchengensis]|uniref:Uncharacterized protein n=1 Tax=Nocardioides lianchengensis TaxID=1045774 RepID=A0A1G7BJ66_9ACTN|nr:hypothetical protein [Nocardioides lianchengensis]NYG08975.1 hypothetical protein [Nocardioides lianchengensis]SDE27138.1 hypothetical protein SAMN05421872_11839 [Nocardioides lianchengensis]